MSDDDDVIFVKKTRSVHYGSLEEQEKARLALLSSREETTATGTDLGDINISSEYMDLEDEMSKDKQALLEEFERRRKARQLNVSTDDEEVRRNLRQLGEPQCLFGEGPAERRIRLRDLLSFLGEDAIHKKMEEEEARLERDRGREATWYHEGGPELRAARKDIALYSLPRAKERLNAARKQLEQPGSVRAAARQDAQRRAANVSIYCSQIGDNRPISYCRFSSDSKMLATSSWSGLCKVWSVPECRPLQELRGHTCQVSCVEFAPNATIPAHFTDKLCEREEEDVKTVRECPDIETIVLDGESATMASCSYDGAVHLWNFSSSSPLASLEGHSPHRVSRVAYHPSGRYLAAAVFDGSWRLWDLAAAREVLHQEGHAKEVYCVAMQCDGSLAASGGMDAFGRVWDLRTGRCVMFLEGHLDSVLGVDWSPAGYRLATAAADNTARVWDLRQRRHLYTVPAHTDLVSGVRYQPSNGHFLVTSSYDRSARVWSDPGWHPLNTLSGHDNKVMSADISYDNKYIATSSYDRTFKLWAPENS